MGEIALAAIVAAIVLALVALLAIMSWDFRDDDYASMDRRLARRRDATKQGRGPG